MACGIVQITLTQSTPATTWVGVVNVAGVDYPCVLDTSSGAPATWTFHVHGQTRTASVGATTSAATFDGYNFPCGVVDVTVTLGPCTVATTTTTLPPGQCCPEGDPPAVLHVCFAGGTSVLGCGDVDLRGGWTLLLADAATCQYAATTESSGIPGGVFGSLTATYADGAWTLTWFSSSLGCACSATWSVAAPTCAGDYLLSLVTSTCADATSTVQISTTPIAGCSPATTTTTGAPTTTTTAGPGSCGDCPDMPGTICIDPSGFVNGTNVNSCADCEAWNAPALLNLVSSGPFGCSWESAPVAGCYVDAPEGNPSAHQMGFWQLTFEGGPLFSWHLTWTRLDRTGGVAVWSGRALNCALPFTLDLFTSNSTCDGWPATITINACSSTTTTTAGPTTTSTTTTSAPCACPGGMTTISVTLSGWHDGTAAGCAALDGTWTLPLVGACQWEGVLPGIFIAGSAVTVSVVYTGVFWSVIVSTVSFQVQYILSAADCTLPVDAPRTVTVGSECLPPTSAHVAA